MQKDGRFAPMVFVDHKPTGNASFFSNGTNKVLLQNLGIDNFRPNKVTDYSGEKDAKDAVAWVCSTLNYAEKIARRPDLIV